MNIHGILLQEMSVFASISFNQFHEESNICSVGYGYYRTPEFNAVFTAACHRSLYRASDSCLFPDIQFL